MPAERTRAESPIWTGHTSPCLSAIATPNRALCAFWAGGDPDAIVVLIRRQLRGGRRGGEWGGVEGESAGFPPAPAATCSTSTTRPRPASEALTPLHIGSHS